MEPQIHYEQNIRIHCDRVKGDIEAEADNQINQLIRKKNDLCDQVDQYESKTIQDLATNTQFCKLERKKRKFMASVDEDKSDNEAESYWSNLLNDANRIFNRLITQKSMNSTRFVQFVKHPLPDRHSDNLLGRLKFDFDSSSSFYCMSEAADNVDVLNNLQWITT